MSCQGYLKTIKTKTGKSPDDFRQLAHQKGSLTEGILKPDVKASEITRWVAKDFSLGQGHTMAIYTLLKGLKDQHSE